MILHEDIRYESIKHSQFKITSAVHLVRQGCGVRVNGFALLFKAPFFHCPSEIRKPHGLLDRILNIFFADERFENANYQNIPTVAQSKNDVSIPFL